MEKNKKTDVHSTTKPMQPEIVNYLFAKAGASRTPLSGTFELTPRCNFNCKMCYVHLSKEEQEARGKELSAKEWIALGEACSKAGMLFLLLTGGEPLLRPDFKEIYSGLKALGLIISINTNGSLIDDDMIAFFKDNPPNKFNITLYGSNPDVYRDLNGNPDAFDKTMHAIKTLHDNGFNVKLNCTITPYNRDDVKNIKRIVNELGVKVQYGEYMFPPIRINENKAGTVNRLTAKDTARLMIENMESKYFTREEYLSRLRKLAHGIKVIDPDDECMDVPTAGEMEATEIIRCRAGSSAFWVAWDGMLMPCGMMIEPCANINELGFNEAWKRVNEARVSIMMPPKCTNCDKRFACNVCAASTYCETGCFGKDAPEYICEITKEYISLAKEEYEKLWDAGEYDKYNVKKWNE